MRESLAVTGLFSLCRIDAVCVTTFIYLFDVT